MLRPPRGEILRANTHFSVEMLPLLVNRPQLPINVFIVNINYDVALYFTKKIHEINKQNVTDKAEGKPRDRN